MSHNQNEIKVAIIGPSGVGKTDLIEKWKNPDASVGIDTEPTIGAGFGVKNIVQNDKKYSLQIWDVSGQNRFRPMMGVYLRGAKIALFVFDVSDQNGLEGLDSIVIEAKKHIEPDASLILIGNKQDKGFQVNPKDITTFEQRHNIQRYLVVSAKNGFGMDMFANLIGETVSTYVANHKPAKADSSTMQELIGKINTLKTFHQESPNRSGTENISKIAEMLESGIKAEFPQQYFNEHLPDFQKNLDALRWTWRSVLNTVLNVILTVFATLTVVGLPLLFCLGLWNPNGHNNGVMNSFRFCKFGDKQKMQQLCEDIFVERDIKGCQFGS
ncbi:MAG: Rab family GTPase [Gammaproteobacteria bacterium]